MCVIRVICNLGEPASRHESVIRHRLHEACFPDQARSGPGRRIWPLPWASKQRSRNAVCSSPVKFDRVGGELLLNLITDRYERRATVVNHKSGVCRVGDRVCRRRKPHDRLDS